MTGPNMPSLHDQPLTTSILDIAELTGERHDHVMRDTAEEREIPFTTHWNVDPAMLRGDGPSPRAVCFQHANFRTIPDAGLLYLQEAINAARTGAGAVTAPVDAGEEAVKTVNAIERMLELLAWEVGGALAYEPFSGEPS